MALDLGMKVVGFDPGITVEGAWQLSADVEKAASVEEAVAAFGKIDIVVCNAGCNRRKPAVDVTSLQTGNGTRIMSSSLRVICSSGI